MGHVEVVFPVYPVLVFQSFELGARLNHNHPTRLGHGAKAQANDMLASVHYLPPNSGFTSSLKMPCTVI